MNLFLPFSFCFHAFPWRKEQPHLQSLALCLVSGLYKPSPNYSFHRNLIKYIRVNISRI